MTTLRAYLTLCLFLSIAISAALFAYLADMQGRGWAAVWDLQGSLEVWYSVVVTHYREVC